MNLVERVAMAVIVSSAEVSEDEARRILASDDAADAGQAYAARELATAAIAAMREPTPEMIEAACEARNMVAGTRWTDGATEGVQAIERMLAEKSLIAAFDAALAATEGGGDG